MSFYTSYIYTEKGENYNLCDLTEQLLIVSGDRWWRHCLKDDEDKPKKSSICLVK